MDIVISARKNLCLLCMGFNKIFMSLLLVLSILFTFNSFALSGDCQDPDYPDQYPYYSLAEICDGVKPIVFDREHSVETLDNNSSGTITITGGNGNYTWSISGNGFSFNATSLLTSQQTTAQSITIYTTGTACGTGNVTVADGCFSVVRGVASTNGRWGPVINGIGQHGLLGEYTGQHSGGSYIYMGESKTYRQFERRLSTSGCGSSASCSFICYNSCGSPDTNNCTLGCDAFGCCTHFESVFSNIEYHKSAPYCIDFLGRDGLLGGAAGYGSSCSCNCTTSNWYQEWTCQ